MNEQFEHQVTGGGILFKQARGMRDIIGKEFHPYHEILLFKEGEAEFISEKYRQKLRPNDLILIPKENFHQFEVKNDASYCRCVFKFGNIDRIDALIALKMNAVRILPATEQMVQLIDKTVTDSPKYRESERAVLLFCMLSLLLFEIDIAQEQGESTKNRLCPVSREAIAYINNHLTKRLKITDIAAALHVSVSHLNHLFKEDLHIPIYKYILEKKLVLAHQKIESGVYATQAALECGFNDYSGFYKQYKKMFGHSPAFKAS